MREGGTYCQKKRVNDSLKEANCKDFLLLGVARQRKVKLKGEVNEVSIQTSMKYLLDNVEQRRYKQLKSLKLVKELLSY